MKIVHTSDFHLEKSFKSSSISFEFSDLRRKNIWKSVENLVDQVQKTKADYLFIVGDLFEEDYFTLTDGKRLFDLLSKTEAKVYIVFGNHDPLNKDSVILLEQIRTIDKKRLREKIGCLDKNMMLKIDNSLQISLGLFNM